MTSEIGEFWFMKKILWHGNFTRIFWQNFVIFTHDKSDNDIDQNKSVRLSTFKMFRQMFQIGH